jgi:hypothetical protein
MVCGLISGMARTPIIVIEGARIELDGKEVLVLIIPFSVKPENLDVSILGQQIADCSKSFPLVLAHKRADGGCSVVTGHPLKEKLEAKNPAEFCWTKVPIFAADDGT